MAFKRDLFTGKLVRVKESGEGRRVIYREPIPESMQLSRSGSVWGRPWVSQSLGIANIDQRHDFNEAARAYAGPGVSFDEKGRLVCESRGARNRALKWLGKVDYDAGYGDHC